jgi:hypothetical protein
MKRTSEHSPTRVRGKNIKQASFSVKRISASVPDDIAARLSKIIRCVRQIRTAFESFARDISTIILLSLRIVLDFVFASWMIYFVSVKHLHPDGLHEMLLTCFSVAFIARHLIQILKTRLP